MTRLCERPGCSAPADVAYGFEAEHRAVWLDHLTAPGAARAGALCRRHADAMVVPLGWSLDDRREMAPRLFPPRRRRATEDEPGSAEVRAGGGRAPAPARREGRKRRARADADDTGQLAFDALDAAAEVGVQPDDATAQHEPPTGAAATVESHETAADSAPAAETGTGETGTDETGEAETGADAAPVDPTSPLDRPATPWQPVFDQRDDLDGLLSARSSLLSRAFRGTPRPGA